MTLVFIGLCAGLSACTSWPSGQPAGTGPRESADESASTGLTCDSSPVMSLVGKTLTPELTDSAREQSHSATTRVLRPGEVMTMEYNPARLNLIVDGQGKVITIHCG